MGRHGSRTGGADPQCRRPCDRRLEPVDPRGTARQESGDQARSLGHGLRLADFARPRIFRDAFRPSRERAMKLVTLTSEPGRRLKPDDVIALEVDGLGGACAIASSGYRDMTD